jgi:hypothetical protein
VSLNRVLERQRPEIVQVPVSSASFVVDGAAGALPQISVKRSGSQPDTPGAAVNLLRALDVEGRGNAELLDAVLWSLRAEVESQLRHLSRAQKHLSGRDRRADLTQVLVELDAAFDCHKTIRSLYDASLDEAITLAAVPEPRKTSNDPDEPVPVNRPSNG